MKSRKPGLKSPKITRRGFLRAAVNVLLGGAFLSVGGWKYMEFEAGWFVTRRETFKLKGLPDAFSGMVIAHLSDLHFSPFITPERFSEVVDMVNKAAPDVVLITGDFIDGRTVMNQLPVYTDLLARIDCTKGKFGVLGNHDHWVNADKVREMMSASGIEDLSNRNMILKQGEDSIRLCGLDSYMEGREDLRKAMDGLEEGEVAILLVHEPDFADLSGNVGRFALQLSGHSHGGQIYVPMFGPPVTPRFGSKYPRGRYEINGMQLYTNRGIGMIEPFLRLNCRPEVALLTLEPDLGQN